MVETESGRLKGSDVDVDRNPESRWRKAHFGEIAIIRCRLEHPVELRQLFRTHRQEGVQDGDSFRCLFNRTSSMDLSMDARMVKRELEARGTDGESDAQAVRDSEAAPTRMPRIR